MSTTPTPRSRTTTLVVTLHMLSRDIKTDDGAANAALREASDRLSQLQIMVCHAYPIIKAQHGAEHMLDGFKPRRREIDALLALFEREVAEVAQ